jgi:hypothetical protein
VNPTIVEGQIHGGVAQGIGGALYEKLVYDEHGQLLAGSFMDFLMPTAVEIPDITVVHPEDAVSSEPPGELGWAELGVGVAAMLAPWLGPLYALGLCVAGAIFYFGAAVVHAREIAKKGNLSSGNAGPVFYV